MPFWAIWPFETLLLPKKMIHSLGEVSGGVKRSLAAIMQSLTTRYDNLFECSFPYSMGAHGEWRARVADLLAFRSDD